MTEFQLREVFNESIVKKISKNIYNVYPEFNSVSFESQIMEKLPELSFGDRSSLIVNALEEYLPSDYLKSIDIIVQSLDPVKDSDELTGYDGFYIMPLTSYVARNGMKFLEDSLKALYELTIRFTAENDIRPFLIKYPKETLSFLTELTSDKFALGRRLASEGTRPRLPLSSPLKQFIKDPIPVIEILERLKDDPSLVVRRSVANNLNDISKDNPEIVVKTLKKWSENASKERTWLISHALRTLLKQGNPGALELQGYNPNVELDVIVNINKLKISLGEPIEFDISIHNKNDSTQNLMIDYILYFMKANKKQSPKVFKLSKRSLQPNETLSLKKSHVIKQLSTRKIYPGSHGLQLQINGKKFEKIEFQVKY